MIQRELMAVLLNCTPYYLEGPCIVWSGDRVPRFIAVMFADLRGIEYVLFAPEGATLPSFFDSQDDTVSQRLLPNDGGVVYVKQLEV